MRLRNIAGRLRRSLLNSLPASPRHAEALANRDAQISELRDRVSVLERSRQRLLTTHRPGASAPIPVTLGFDIEPDKRVVDLADPSWRFTPLLFGAWNQLRRRLAAKACIPVTWYPRCDPQVEMANGSLDWALRNFDEHWRASVAEGDEIGVHMHPWRWEPALKTWLQDHGDEEWVIHCLHLAIRTYRDHFGHVPSSYRGGDRFLTSAVAAALREAGVTVDLTLERMPAVERLAMSEHGSGQIPDGMSVPMNAYYPSTVDVRVPAKNASGLGMLPLTPGSAGTLVPWLPPRTFDDELERLLERASTNRPSHLAFIARSDLAHLAEWRSFEANIEALAERAQEGQVVFMTASEAWEAARP